MQGKCYLCLPELLRVPPHKHHDLTAVPRNILRGRDTSCPRRAQAVEQAVLDGRAHPFIRRNEATRLLSLLWRPPREIAPDAQRARHRDVEAVAQRYCSFGHEVGTIRDPTHHHPRRVRVAEPLLNAQPVERVGVIAWPHLLHPRQHTQIDTPSTASTRFKRHLRMPPAQLIDDPIQRAHMLEPDPLWIPSGLTRPPRLAEIAVHIP